MTKDNLPDRAWMTPLLNRIADVAGVEAAVTLGRERAGLQIYIPERMTPDHWLAQMVGLEPAIAISKLFGSRKLDIPPAIGGDKRRRAALIAQMIEKGYSINKIVSLTGVSRSTVKEHLKHRPADDRQGSLF